MWKHTSTHPFLLGIGYCSNGNGQVALATWRRVNYALCSLVQLKKREKGCVLVHYDDPPLPDPIQDLVREMLILPNHLKLQSRSMPDHALTWSLVARLVCVASPKSCLWDTCGKPWGYHILNSVSSPALPHPQWKPLTSPEYVPASFSDFLWKASFCLNSFRRWDDVIKNHEHFNTVKGPHQAEKRDSWVLWILASSPFSLLRSPPVHWLYQ